MCTQSPELHLRGREEDGGARDENPELTKNDNLPQTLHLFVCICFVNRGFLSMVLPMVPFQQIAL